MPVLNLESTVAVVPVSTLDSPVSTKGGSLLAGRASSSCRVSKICLAVGRALAFRWRQASIRRATCREGGSVAASMC